MRYNEWQTDRLSLGQAANGVAARYDLEPDPANWACGGAIDAKATSAALMALLSAVVVGGPTHDAQAAAAVQVEHVAGGPAQGPADGPRVWVVCGGGTDVELAQIAG